MVSDAFLFSEDDKQRWRNTVETNSIIATVIEFWEAKTQMQHSAGIDFAIKKAIVSDENCFRRSGFAY